MPKTRLITDPEALREALRDIRPRRAAVAYVGAAWRDLLGDAPELKELVVSPAAGSNPWALEQICEALDWENVHFLERLHSKIYIGPGRVIIGSPNLSSNGFDANIDGSGLFEAVVLSSESEIRRDAEEEFARLRAIARSEYPDKPAMQRRIEAMKAARAALDEAQRKATSRMDAAARPLSFHSYQLDAPRHRIFVEWYTLDDSDGGEEGDVDFLDLNLRSGKDRIRVGDWILIWRATDAGGVHKTPKLAWLRVDEVRENRGENDEYVDQVAQRRKVRGALAPFEITPELTEAFRSVMPAFQDMRPIGDALMSTPKLARCSEFLKALQQTYEPGLI
jgi:hypothetical protein